MDGIRGLACVGVLIHHWCEQYQHNIDYAFGFRSKGSQANDSLWRLPGLRLFYSGGPMVAMFFLLSGYVLSIRTLRLCRTRNWEAVLLGVSSSIFRRAFRIFLPAIVASFFVVLLVQLGLYNFAFDSEARDPVPTELRKLPTLFDQLMDWSSFVVDSLTLPWPAHAFHQESFRYNTNLWTIPLEFQSSIVLYATLVGLSATAVRFRRLLLVVVSGYAMWNGGWCIFLFMQGALLADYDLERPVSEQQVDIEYACEDQGPGCHGILTRTAWIVNLAAGVLIASFPEKGATQTPCYDWLATISQNPRNWYAIGVVQMLWSISQDPLMRSLFEGRWVKALGKISFSLYLVQLPFLMACGFYAVPLLWACIGKDTQVQYQTCFILGFLLVFPIVLWVADIFWRVVEQPCIRAAAFLFERTRVTSDVPGSQ